jgi:hypothetical protein
VTVVGFRTRTVRQPVERVPMQVGQRVKFRAERAPYTVRAVSSDGRWVICTKPFNPQRTVLYTIVDFESGVRGPDNYGGLGYESPEEIARVMERLEEGDAEVSYRYDLCLDIEWVRTIPAGRPATAFMLRALRRAVDLEQNGFQGVAWVAGPERTVQACVRRGLAEEYRVTPNGRPYYRITDAGRALVAGGAR